MAGTRKGKIKWLVTAAAIAVCCMLFQKFMFVEIEEEKFCILSPKADVSHLTTNEELKKLSAFVNLKELNFRFVTFKGKSPDLSFLEKHTKLKELYAAVYGDGVVDFSPLDNCNDIEELGLICYNAEGKCIGQMSELKKLILQTEVINDIGLIWNCGELEHIGIYMTDDNYDISVDGIGGLDKLEFLYLCGGKVTDAEELCGCEKLSELGLICEPDDVSFLTDMPALKTLHVYEDVLSQQTIAELEEKGVEIEILKKHK